MTLRPSFRPEHVGIVESFLCHHFKASGADMAFVNVSGGLDSSVVVTLCARALGAERVTALWLGDELSRAEDRDHAEEVTNELGVPLRTVDISPMVRAFQEELGIDDRVVLGNVRARCRMVTAYRYSNEENGLVMGTGNKSELLLGYYSRWGDGGVDFLPIGDLYKTQVREMARHLEVPEAIVEKPPSAGLWEGQTDEGELGIAYEDLDRILLGLELEMDVEEVADRTGLPVDRVRRVEEMVRASAFKRRMPLVPKIGVRTVGLDWRE